MNNLVLVVLSCKKYSCVWPIYFSLFNKYWPDCPYEKKLLTDSGELKQFTDIDVIETGVSSWATNLKIGLEKINTEAILLLLEDHFFCKPVETKRVILAQKLFFDNNLGLMRLEPYHKQTKFGLKEWDLNPEFGVIRKDDNYSVSIQPSIWRTQVLLDVLTNGESAWDMEIKGSKRCGKITLPFISLKTDMPKMINYINGLVKGKLSESTIEFLKLENFSLEEIKCLNF